APDLQIPFSIKLYNGSREFAGVSRNTTTSGASSIIGYLVKDEGRGSDWLNDFASSEAMTIKFHSGNEPQWSVKMAGSLDAEKSFRSCISKLGGENTPQAATTSPVPEATQPAQSHQGSIALKSGESVALGDLWYVVNCESILIGPPEV